MPFLLFSSQEAANRGTLDFVSYRYQFLKPPKQFGRIKLASLEDIAAMKLSAIAGRGTKKDFIDLYFLLNTFTLEEMIEFFQSKYPDHNTMSLYRSLTYFDDADLNPIPEMLILTDWDEVKSTIKEKVKLYF